MIAGSGSVQSGSWFKQVDVNEYTLYTSFSSFESGGLLEFECPEEGEIS